MSVKQSQWLNVINRTSKLEPLSQLNRLEETPIYCVWTANAHLPAFNGSELGAMKIVTHGKIMPSIYFVENCDCHSTCVDSNKKFTTI